MRSSCPRPSSEHGWQGQPRVQESRPRRSGEIRSSQREATGHPESGCGRDLCAGNDCRARRRRGHLRSPRLGDAEARPDVLRGPRAHRPRSRIGSSDAPVRDDVDVLFGSRGKRRTLSRTCLSLPRGHHDVSLEREHPANQRQRRRAIDVRTSRSLPPCYRPRPRGGLSAAGGPPR